MIEYEAHLKHTMYQPGRYEVANLQREAQYTKTNHRVYEPIRIKQERGKEGRHTTYDPIEGERGKNGCPSCGGGH